MKWVFNKKFTLQAGNIWRIQGGNLYFKRKKSDHDSFRLFMIKFHQFQYAEQGPWKEAGK